MWKIVAVLLFGLLSGPATAATVEEDVTRYVAIFNGDPGLHPGAAESLAWMGLSDPRLYDVIEKRLLAEYQAARNDRAGKNRVALYIRALGFSGQPQYLPTINSFLKDMVYERYSRVALQDQPLYQKWNPVISNHATFAPQHSDDANRVLNMLRSDDLLLMRLGAKRVYFATQDEAVLELLAQKTPTYAAKTYPRFDETDAVAWMVKALGRANSEKHKPLLRQVAASAPDLKVRDYAMRALNYEK